MTAANTAPFWQLPPLPQPPNDPTWWLLNGRVGWRTLDGSHTSVTRCGNCLSLDFIPGSGRQLGEASGTLGGLANPSNVAITGAGKIFLVDRMAFALKVFDPCCCRFSVYCCFEGTRFDKRKISSPAGIAIAGGNLYLSDTGNARVLVFHLHGLSLRDVWTPPASANLAWQWQPWGLAVDHRGSVFVADPANGCVHRFQRNGRYVGNISGTGSAEWIAFDCCGRLYAATPGQTSALVFDREGRSAGTVARPEDAYGRFPKLPFVTDGNGNLKLGPLCVPPRDSTFDAQGNLLPPPLPADPPAHFFATGYYVSEALDSKLYRCQWHRVVLDGNIPAGTSVRVSTYTNEVRLGRDEIQALDSNSWETKVVTTDPVAGEWDCLVRSDGGRFLWLRLDLFGGGTASPVLESVRVEFPRISLRRFLPAVFGEDPTASNFTDRFLSLFDTTFRSIERQIDNQASWFDPLSAPATPNAENGVDFLSWLASWIGMQLNAQLPLRQRRRLLKEVGKGFPIRGTRYGLWQRLLTFLGMTPDDCCCPDNQPQKRCILPPSNCRESIKQPCAWVPPPLILEHYQLRRWLVVGMARLSDQAILWGKKIMNRSQLGANAQVGVTKLLTTPDPDHDPFLSCAYKFSVFVPVACGKSDLQKRALMDLLEVEKPAHTQCQIEYVGPRFRVGFQSMIGLDSVVGRYPSGYVLGQTPLSQGSVLSASPDAQNDPAFSIGPESRIGTSTRLE